MFHFGSYHVHSSSGKKGCGLREKWKLCPENFSHYFCTGCFSQSCYLATASRAQTLTLEEQNGFVAVTSSPSHREGSKYQRSFSLAVTGVQEVHGIVMSCRPSLLVSIQGVMQWGEPGGCGWRAGSGSCPHWPTYFSFRVWVILLSLKLHSGG